MRFSMPDGQEVSGRSYEDVVFAMSGEKLVEPRSQASYRRATARRISSAYNVVVDSSDDRSFVLSLEAAGLLKRLS